MSRPISRRRFLSRAGAAAAIASAPAILSARSANAQLNIACVGVGGKGWSDMLLASVGQNVVAICDVDQTHLAKAAERFPKARTYRDWRKLLEQKDIDAVTVSTPEHMHAPITISAMQRGKHVYTQKPLTHSVYEARRLAEVAQQQGVVTQMGIQHHATRRLKSAVQAIRDRVIGEVSAVHVWTDRPGRYWQQGLRRPPSADSVPAELDWNLWLGVAPERPFSAGAYHPKVWRGWWDFGTGVAGDMGCHLLDPVVHALRLGPPRTIRAEGPPPLPESGPEWCIIHYEFPGTEYTEPTVDVVWYEAGRQPPREVFRAPADWPGSDNGVLFVGRKGNLFVGFPEMPELLPKGEFSEYRFADVPDHDHYRQWTEAIVAGSKTSCPFSYSGPLTETVLLGNVAYRSGETIQWDSAALRVTNVTSTNAADANSLLRRAYRDGWSVDGLSD